MSQHIARESKLSTLIDTKKADEKAQRLKSSLPYLVKQKMDRRKENLIKHERSLQRCKRTLPRGSRIETDSKRELIQASYGEVDHVQKGPKARSDSSSNAMSSKLPPILQFIPQPPSSPRTAEKNPLCKT